MKALDKKLWRELWAMRMQAVAIALVIVSGVSIFIMSLSTLDSLYETRENYYRNNHFAHVFSSLKRAPLSLLEVIEAMPAVDKVETRVVAYVNLDVAGFADPVSGHLLSLPDNSRGLLNQIYLRKGRLPEPGRDNEVLLSEEFAEAHGLQAGDTLNATINGRRKTLTVVGQALSPEYIYQIAPGAMFPDYQRYGVLWMARKPLASAYDMDGAFNDVTLTLGKGGHEQDSIDRLDELLKPYGGIGAYARKDQLSNRFLSEELKQQKTIATVFPVIFFGVAAFLLNVVISRLISLEREQIAGLKAFGYSNFAVGLHYTKLVLMIVSARGPRWHRRWHLDGQGYEPHLHGVLQPAVHGLYAQAAGDHFCSRDQHCRGHPWHPVRRAQCRPLATGTGNASGAACAVSRHPGRAPRPATLVFPADAHDTAPHRTPAREVVVDHAGYQHGLRHHDDWRISGRRHRSHG